MTAARSSGQLPGEPASTAAANQNWKSARSAPWPAAGTRNVRPPRRDDPGHAAGDAPTNLAREGAVRPPGPSDAMRLSESGWHPAAARAAGDGRARANRPESPQSLSRWARSSKLATDPGRRRSRGPRRSRQDVPRQPGQDHRRGRHPATVSTLSANRPRVTAMRHDDRHARGAGRNRDGADTLPPQVGMAAEGVSIAPLLAMNMLARAGRGLRRTGVRLPPSRVDEENRAASASDARADRVVGLELRRARPRLGKDQSGARAVGRREFQRAQRVHAPPSPAA